MIIKSNKEAATTGEVAEERKIEIVKPQLTVTKTDRKLAVDSGVVPKAYENCEFNIDSVIENAKNQSSGLGKQFGVRNIEKYAELLHGVLSGIMIGEMPDRSYIIGAPNGFGKTSFVYTSLLRMYNRGWKTVPYLSLTELAEIKMQNERELVTGLNYGNMFLSSGAKGTRDSNTSSTSNEEADGEPSWTWRDFMVTPLLFTFMTGVSSKYVESYILKDILTVRGAKGLPTIVMMDTSIVPYTSDKKLAELVWNDIIECGSRKTFDRVTHVSCYRDYNI